MKRLIQVSFLLLAFACKTKDAASPKPQPTVPPPNETPDASSWGLFFQKQYLNIHSIELFDDKRGVALGRVIWLDSEGDPRREFFGLFTTDGGPTGKKHPHL